MTPVRILTTSKYFKHKDEFIIACYENDHGSFKSDVHDIEDRDSLKPPPLSFGHIIDSMKTIKSSVSNNNLYKHEEFTAKYGQFV